VRPARDARGRLQILAAVTIGYPSIDRGSSPFDSRIPSVQAVANTEELQRPPPPAVAIDAGRGPSATDPLREGLLLFAATLALCVICYVAATVPGAWFPAASAKTWNASELVFSRGGGGLDNGELVIASGDAAGTALITLDTDLRSTDYSSIAWNAIDVPEELNVRLLWRNDYTTAKLNSVPLTVASGRLLPASVAKDPNWIGRIRGLALLIQGPITNPLRVRGVVAKPLGALEIAADRAREWLAFEGFTGTSIDSVTGGADVQDLPLPVLLALAVALAAGAAFALAKIRNRMATLPVVLATVFVVAWLVQDARWTWDLARQVRATALRYAGRDTGERHLAAEDGALFAFIEHVRAKLPPTPARVYMAADTPYLRGRGAYHLYPHNVLFDPYVNALPPRARLRPGDYLVVYQRRGVQYDPGGQRLRWDGGEPISAELVVSEPGAALFRIR